MKKRSFKYKRQKKFELQKIETYLWLPVQLWSRRRRKGTKDSSKTWLKKTPKKPTKDGLK